MPLYTDQTGRKTEIVLSPQRIISLVPSQTELLFDLGLEHRVKGITKFCVHPEKWFREKIRVGGTKTFNAELIESLQPDLILANKEENNQELLTGLMEKFPVWVSDVADLETAIDMISSVGSITDTIKKSDAIISNIQTEFHSLHEYISEQSISPQTVAYFIWQKPWMSIGEDTFIADMIRKCDLKNVFENITRYPEISLEKLIKANPQLVFLSSEPFPFKNQHIAEIQDLLPDSKVILVDGEYFSWYGSRLMKAPVYFKSILQSLKSQ